VITSLIPKARNEPEIITKMPAPMKIHLMSTIWERLIKPVVARRMAAVITTSFYGNEWEEGLT